MKGIIRYGAAAVLAATVLGAAPARADTLSFSGFSSTSGLTLNGDAHTTTTSDGTVLRLASATQSQHGTAFTNDRHNVASFSTYFTFRITNPGGVTDGFNPQTGADGITVIVQHVAPTALGGTGEFIGYGGPGLAGIQNSVAVEFDTWSNPFSQGDASSNHVGVNVNGSMVSINQVAATPNFDDGNLWHAWIDYDGAVLSVRANQTGVRPALAILQQAIVIPAFTGSTDAFVGFGSATGGAYGDHDIVSWTFQDRFNPNGAGVPLPGVAWAGLALLGGVAAKRLRHRKAPVA